MPSLVSHSAQALEWETLIKVWLPRTDKVSTHKDTAGNPVHHSNTKKIKKTTTFERMFGFDAKYVFFWFSLGFFLFFFGSEWKTFFFFWMDMINQGFKKPYFLIWDFSMQKTKPKMLKNTKNLDCLLWDLDWSYPLKKQKPKFFLFFHFRTKTKAKNPGKTKNNNLLSQNQTFSQQFILFWFCLSFLFFPVLFAFLDVAQVVRASGSKLKPPPKSLKILFFLMQVWL